VLTFSPLLVSRKHPAKHKKIMGKNKYKTISAACHEEL
jgi:hypothetical protein